MHIDLIRDTLTAMPAVDRSIDSLRIWHCRYETLTPVGELTELRTLLIATYPDESLEILKPLGKLQSLRILHMPRVRDLGPLAELQRLESLSLETLPSWDSSRKITEVESLGPIASLSGLKHLALFGVVPRTKSLSALEGCRNLVSARFSKYPETEVQRFYEATRISNVHIPEPGAG